MRKGWRRTLKGRSRCLAALEREHPASGLLWQERALCLTARGEEAAAAAALRQAVELNDALPESWHALIALARAAGDAAELARATSALAKLETLPPELSEGSSRLSEGDLDGAEEIIRGYLRRHGPHLDGMRLLAQASADRKNYDDAELLLEAVLDRNPDYHEARYELGKVFLQRRRFYPALLQAQKLLPLNPADRRARKLYAGACDGLGRFDEALRVYSELLAETPDDQESEFSIAFGLRNQGKSEEAIAGFRRLMRLPASVGSAYAALADMKTHRFSDEDIAVMRRIEADPDLAPQHLPVCFALGKAMEDRKQYQESFRYYERGNALRRAETSYNAEALERTVGMRETLFTREFLAARRLWDASGPTRSSSSACRAPARRCSSRSWPRTPQVEGTQELPDIPRMVKQLQGRDVRSEPAALSAVLAELSAGGAAPARRELPRGHAGLPRGRAVLHRQDAEQLPAHRPDPPDAAEREDHRCAARADGLLLQQLQAAVRQRPGVHLRPRGHRALLPHLRRADAHWDHVLPGRVLRVQHEDVVDDLEGSVRRMLELLRPAVRAGRASSSTRPQRSVRTASSEQVRQPIYRDGLEQWRTLRALAGALEGSFGATG